jgi:hypothetical protein
MVSKWTSIIAAMATVAVIGCSYYNVVASCSVEPAGLTQTGLCLKWVCESTLKIDSAFTIKPLFRKT